MKAWRVEKHGGSEVLHWTDVQLPEPRPNEVRINVLAVGLNHLDVWLRKGVPGHRFPLPLTPGCDIVGAIDAFGSEALRVSEQEGLKVATKILVNPGISCGKCSACLGGFDPLCPRYGILGETQDGGCADSVCVPINNVIALPHSLEATTAAALPIPYLTAYTMLFRKAALKAGETVLIHAGGSAVSIAAIQFARMLGAVVITTVGTDSKVAKAHALGADHVINYRSAPFRDELKKILTLLGRKGCDVVIDHVGFDTFTESLKSLAWGGRLVTCGATTGGKVEVDLKALFFKNQSIHGSTMGSKADLLKIVDLAARTKIVPLIDSVMPMNQLPIALERLENREVFGKIVLAN